MNRLWKYIKEKWGNTTEVKADRPFIHESIDFSEYPPEDYNQWVHSSHHKLLSKRLSQAYFHYMRSGTSADNYFEFFDTPMSKGFIMFLQEGSGIGRNDLLYWQYYIGELLKNNGYTSQLAERKSHKKGPMIESITKFYLKPSAKHRVLKPAKQLYGNISIEYIDRDDRPYMIRTLANYYQDKNFASPLPFDEFIQLISEIN